MSSLQLAAVATLQETAMMQDAHLLYIKLQTINNGEYELVFGS